MKKKITEVFLVQRIGMITLALTSVVIGLLLTSFQSSGQTTTLTVGGKSRNMIVYAPSGIAQNRPLIIQMHGLNQDAAYQKAQAKWEPIADTGKFIVAFPNGINKSWDISGSTDTDFILAIIDNLYTKYGIDKSRVYLSGFSMGGMMTYHSMGKIADKIAAFAPVSGYTLSGAKFTSSRPIPILHTHGDADDVVGYGGVANIMSGWVKRDNCPTTAKITKPYPSTKPNSLTTKSYWGLGDCQTEVVLMTLAGKGHWYSTDIAGGTHTSVEIWNFCKRYSTSCGMISSNTTSVSITSPANNATYTSPASITINANASKTGGTVSKVEFYNGTTKLGEDATSPYSYLWANVAMGSYTITAVATDNSGAKTTSAAVMVKVSQVTGLEEQAENQGFLVFPNPFNNDGILIDSKGDFQYQISDLKGAVLEEGIGKDLKSIGNKLDAGIYVLSLKNSNRSSIQKIIKQQ